MSPRTVIAGVLRGCRGGGGGGVWDAAEGRPVVVRTPGEGVAPSGTVRVEPLAGPVHCRPVGLDRRTAAGMLLTAVEGLSLGAADRALIARARDVWDAADTAVLASLIERARVEGRVVAASVSTAWAPWCEQCRLEPVDGPWTQGGAEQLARIHDAVHHGGAWTAQARPVVEVARLAAGGVW